MAKAKASRVHYPLAPLFPTEDHIIGPSTSVAPVDSANGSLRIGRH